MATLNKSILVLFSGHEFGTGPTLFGAPCTEPSQREGRLRRPGVLLRAASLPRINLSRPGNLGGYVV